MEKVKVTGIQFFKDTIDGEHIDSGAVHIEERLNDRNNEKCVPPGSCAVIARETAQPHRRS